MRWFLSLRYRTFVREVGLYWWYIDNVLLTMVLEKSRQCFSACLMSDENILLNKIKFAEHGNVHYM